MLPPVRTPRSIAAWSAPLALAACALGGPRPFAPPVPEVVARNQAAGDPYSGRFPMDEALAGLPEGPALHATLETDAGEVHCRLDASSAPMAVANFVGLARGLRPFQAEPGGPWQTAPFFDGVPFHRAVAGQFVQTGRRGAQETPGFWLQDEMSSGHVFDRAGLLALANAGTPHSGAAQFFVTTSPLGSLNGKHTIFGTCDDEDVVRELERRALASPADPPRLLHVEIRRGA
jgi:peptidyl-prolyl cis-trans isomerase A (cyclophilin A)